jgi:hypothetical protein
MAGLTGRQIFPRFAGMASGPLMARQYRVGVTPLALLIIKEGVITTEGAIGEAFAMRVKRQIGLIEIVMAVHAELVFMAFVTELRVGARRDRMGDRELGTVHVGHGVTELPHFISTTGFVAFKAEILFVTGRTINGFAHRGAAVIQRPGRTVGEQTRPFNRVNKGLIVTLKADFAVRLDTWSVLHMAGDTGRIPRHGEVCIVFKIGGPEGRCSKEQADVEQ